MLSTTGLLGPAEIASVRPARFPRDSGRALVAVAADPVRWHHDLATEPALTAGQAAALLAVDEDQAGRILGWLRSRGLLLAVRRPDGPAYLRFQFDPVGRGLHRVVALSTSGWLPAAIPTPSPAGGCGPGWTAGGPATWSAPSMRTWSWSSPPPTSTGRCSPSACNPNRSPGRPRPAAAAQRCSSTTANPPHSHRSDRRPAAACGGAGGGPAMAPPPPRSRRDVDSASSPTGSGTGAVSRRSTRETIRPPGRPTPPRLFGG